MAGFSRYLPRYAGFTIIESVLVILVIGILSAFVMSRMFGGSAFDDVVLRDQIVSLSRTAQQSALGRTGVSLTVTPNGSGDQVSVAVIDGGGTIESVNVSMDSLSLSGDINETDSCGITNGAQAISSATPMTVFYDSLGNAGTSGVTGNTGAVTSAVRICINNDPSVSVCISPSGFAHIGDCDV
ncbi:MAG: type II secretion system protein [Pseudohongiellaceae bacterium]